MSKVCYPDEPNRYSFIINTSWAGIRQTYIYPGHRKDRVIIADDNIFEGL